MKVESFVKILGVDFYTGVPDSQLKALCNYLMNQYGIDSNHHIIAANEGNCAALAAGYNLATGKVPVVYMQNSGQGNMINPLASLLHDKVYGIPVIFVIGWRGEPGVHDEPQHLFQGEITNKLLEVMGIDFFILDEETPEAALQDQMNFFRKKLANGQCVAFVIKKNALTYDRRVDYQNSNTMNRENVIQAITKISEDDLIISSTGKVSRELFEIREKHAQSHKYDFLTVGSMGHASSIALGIALNTPDRKIWCVDGDGAMLMHMGALAVIGAQKPMNLVHILINNEAHETVGGMPTVSDKVDFVGVAKACGYPRTVCVDNFERLENELQMAKKFAQLSFIEVRCALGARTDLGRPTISPKENKVYFEKFIRGIK